MNMRTLLQSGVFASGIFAIGALAATRAVPFAPPAADGVRTGEYTRSFEAHYEAAFPTRSFGINLWAAVQYLLFREGRPDVVVGSADWLYTAEEFRGWPGADASLATNLDLIAAVDRSLSRRGTTLIVALIPAKARLYPEFHRTIAAASLHRDLYTRARRGLLDRGVTTPDLFASLADCKAAVPVFLRTDTHWTPAGANCAAQEIAQTAQRLRRTTARPQTYFTHAGRSREHKGDLMRFLPLDPHFSSLLPAADLFETADTAAAFEPDLLADSAPPEAVLIGTSYSADPLWNFGGALREHLQEDVLNLADVGHGPFAPMFAYLDTPTGASAPRLLIWEIPERYLPMPPAERPAAVSALLLPTQPTSQPPSQPTSQPTSLPLPTTRGGITT
ncbi:MAG: hypothetical protein WC809_04170 [Sinimarinibacterium sp.]|jgi:alginate O-acetyltransferase complex protein AlgJ